MVQVNKAPDSENNTCCLEQLELNKKGICLVCSVFLQYDLQKLRERKFLMGFVDYKFVCSY